MIRTAPTRAPTRALPGALTVTLLAVAVLLTGCAARPAAPRTAAAPASTSIAPVATPTAVSGEVVRSTFGAGGVRQPVGRVPAAPSASSSGAGDAPDGDALGVQVACSGTDGSTMTWTLETGEGKPLGLGGEADCAGPATTQWLGLADQRPTRIRVALQPASGVVSGYAVVRLGTP